MQDDVLLASLDCERQGVSVETERKVLRGPYIEHGQVERLEFGRRAPGADACGAGRSGVHGVGVNHSLERVPAVCHSNLPVGNTERYVVDGGSLFYREGAVALCVEAKSQVADTVFVLEHFVSECSGSDDAGGRSKRFWKFVFPNLVLEADFALLEFLVGACTDKGVHDAVESGLVPDFTM